MKRLFLFAILISGFQAHADTLTLPQCIDLSLTRHPVAEQRILNAELSGILNETVATSRYPSLVLNGQVTYQSDVVSFPDNPLISPDIPKLQSRLFLEVQQLIYNGGKTNIQSEINGIRVELEDLEVDRAMNETRKQVSSLYFGILVINARLGILNEGLAQLNRQRDVLNSLLENGVILAAGVDRLDLELLKIESEIRELQTDAESLHQVLDTWTGLSTSEMILVLPEGQDLSAELNTPELKIMDKNREILMNSARVSLTDKKPSLAFFLQGGMGQPNPFNFFETDFQPYYIGGLKLSWRILDYGRTVNSARVNELQSEKIRLNMTFSEEMVQRQQIRLEKERESLDQLLENDLKSVAIQENILSVAEVQLEEGSITTSEYLAEITTLNRLKIQMELRNILKVKSSWDESILTGNLE